MNLRKPIYNLNLLYTHLVLSLIQPYIDFQNRLRLILNRVRHILLQKLFFFFIVIPSHVLNLSYRYIRFLNRILLNLLHLFISLIQILVLPQIKILLDFQRNTNITRFSSCLLFYIQCYHVLLFVVALLREFFLFLTNHLYFLLVIHFFIYNPYTFDNIACFLRIIQKIKIMFELIVYQPHFFILILAYFFLFFLFPSVHPQHNQYRMVIYCAELFLRYPVKLFAYIKSYKKKIIFHKFIYGSIDIFFHINAFLSCVK